MSPDQGELRRKPPPRTIYVLIVFAVALGWVVCMYFIAGSSAKLEILKGAAVALPMIAAFISLLILSDRTHRVRWDAKGIYVTTGGPFSPFFGKKTDFLFYHNICSIGLSDSLEEPAGRPVIEILGRADLSNDVNSLRIDPNFFSSSSTHDFVGTLIERLPHLTMGDEQEYVERLRRQLGLGAAASRRG